jgi:predicted dehydrogenase
MHYSKRAYDRRKFIKASALAGIALGLTGSLAPLPGKAATGKGKRIGIIGLDTSHSVEFTKELNATDAPAEFKGYKVVAAYPKGSSDIESSVKRIPGYTEEVKKMGVEIVDSVAALLEKADVVLLETNDGRWRLEQAMPVLKAKKPMFIDKPVAASLTDVITIFEAAKHYDIPVFSASSLRYMSSAQEIAAGKIGKVSGADTFSPCTLEKTHPDLFWYGIHGVEILYTVMGRGCRELVRVHTDDADLVTGTWADGRIGSFRGTRTGGHLYGGTVFGEKANAVLGPFEGYKPLLLQIIDFFETGKPPVSAEETMEIYAFMEAADESKRRNGGSVVLDEVWTRAKLAADSNLKKLTA